MNKLWRHTMSLEQRLQMLEDALQAGTIDQATHDAEALKAQEAHEAAVALAAEEARKKKIMDDMRDATGATKSTMVINYAVNQRIAAAFDRMNGNDYDSRMKNRLASDLTRAVRGTSSSFNP